MVLLQVVGWAPIIVIMNKWDLFFYQEVKHLRLSFELGSHSYEIHTTLGVQKSIIQVSVIHYLKQLIPFLFFGFHEGAQVLIPETQTF